jgi:hypothetical protein
MNPDLPELKQSIRTRGLLNQIDVFEQEEEVRRRELGARAIDVVAIICS